MCLTQERRAWRVQMRFSRDSLWRYCKPRLPAMERKRDNSSPKA